VNQHRVAVIMAGGRGARLWPAGGELKPKQFLALVDERTLLQATSERIAPLIPQTRQFVVAGHDQQALVRADLPGLDERLILEPEGRNTAPCIGLSAVHVLAADPQAVVAVLPADHWVTDEVGFCAVLDRAFELAQVPGRIVTVGITPTRAHTGFGYLQLSGPADPAGVPLNRFVEKPDGASAARMVGDGEHLWNGGIFVALAQTLLDEIERQLPATGDALAAIAQSLGSEAYASTLEARYRACDRISIDHGVMEAARDVWCVPADVGWSDVGNWDALGHARGGDEAGNSVVGSATLIDTTNCVVDAADGITVSAIGIDGLVVVATANQVLVTARADCEKVRELAPDGRAR
jgi:mannose-1-phosphate guanylyltransferase